MEITDLDTDDRMRLVRFLCSFAWADLDISDAEKDFIRRMLRELGLEETERAQAEKWLVLPPLPEEVDPTDIPQEHRQVFLNAILQLVGADGFVAEKEMETLALFEKLLRTHFDEETIPG